MPFCTQCGTEVEPSSAYCGKCGKAQKPGQPGTSPLHRDPFAEVSDRTASLLCYIPVLGWLAAIVILASARFKEDTRVRFNAFQGLYLFVAWLLADWVVGPLFSILPGSGFMVHAMFAGLLKVAIFGAWIVMIVKTSQNELYKLPILGDLAERAVSEQR